MGIQTTLDITRELAEKAWIDKMLKKEREILLLEVKYLSNEEIEDFIEKDFYNYNIK